MGSFPPHSLSPETWNYIVEGFVSGEKLKLGIQIRKSLETELNLKGVCITWITEAAHPLINVKIKRKKF